MRGTRFCWLLSGVVALLFGTWGLAAELAVPELTGRVVDQAGMLSPAEERRLADRIRQLEEATGGQMAVLTIPSLGGEPLEAFSLKVAETWKIGCKGQDNGAILLVSKQDRKIRLEIGYGWEGDITDGQAGDIIRSMGYPFRREEYARGIDLAIGEVCRLTAGSQVALAAAAQRDSARARNELRDQHYTGHSTKRLFVVMGIAVGVVGLMFLLGWVLPCRQSFFLFDSSESGMQGRSGRSFWGNNGGYGRYGGYGGGRTSGGGGFSGGGGGFGGGGASGGW